MPKDAFIHSDQGVRYTSPVFQKFVRKSGLSQSMLEEEIAGTMHHRNPFLVISKMKPIKKCNTLEELKGEIKQYMTYYNHYRYQWDLRKMTPVQYRNHLLKTA